MKWYVLYTRYHHERAVYERLMRKGFQPYLPLLVVWRKSRGRLRKVVMPLFPRHVFVYCYLEMYAQIELMCIAGVIRLQEDDRGEFLVVSEEEIQLLRRLCESGRSLERAAYQVQGEQVQIVRGRLRGVCGIVPQDTRRILLVPIPTLQTSIAVQVSRRQVRPYVQAARKPGSRPVAEA